jgi:hypothetical protein
MATRKSAAKGPVRTKHGHDTKSSRQSAAGKGTTASGPSHPSSPTTELAEHAAQQAALAASMPFNAAKPSEYAPADPTTPPQGPHENMPSPTTGASTLSEKSKSAKTGPATV